MRYYAHTGQLLVDHLREVGELASQFTEKFDAALHGETAGLLHDLGKAEDLFQERLAKDDSERNSKKEPHAHHGAALAVEANAWPIAFAINGHHAGLHDRSDVERIRAEYLPKARACMSRLHERHPDWEMPKIPATLPGWLTSLPFDARRTKEGWFAADVFTRMLFSALVDADSLNTEQHENRGTTLFSSRQWPKLEENGNAKNWLETLKRELADRAIRAKSEGTASLEVQKVWREVGEACDASASQARGLFSFAVPTGGGKTLASMLFALAHATHHNANAGNKPFRRIIVVIPYLSIIHQTVDELRKVFGDDIVLEHHSQADEPEIKNSKGTDTVDGPIDEKARRRRMAAENWDAPIIVTTSVQFFGSLFSRRRSAARKLHNLCQSIVIFDEVQTLPPLLMQPILSVLGELTNHQRPYQCSMVFCTATQPAFEYDQHDFRCGFQKVQPIIPNELVKRHFDALQRVEYEWPVDGQTLTPEQLAERIVGDGKCLDQHVLAVVNTRKAARELHAAVSNKLRENHDIGESEPVDGLFHLSTWMVPAHRREVLEEVKRRLASTAKPDLQRRERCILISTQCIEAGVDVDFPEVWRAFGPYDSIVQAAGRCNRRGLRPTKGKVHVFRLADEPSLPGVYSTATSQTDLLLRMGRANPHDPESFTDYFRLLYQLSVPDECAIQKERAHLHFEQVDRLFQFIDAKTFPLLVLNQRIDHETIDFDKPMQIYERAKARGFLVREDWRQLQPYIINLLHSSRTHGEFNEFITEAIDVDSGLYLWAGNYLGGKGGVGLMPLIPEDYLI